MLEARTYGNALPPRNARSVGDHTVPCSTRIGQRNPQDLGNPHSLQRLEHPTIVTTHTSQPGRQQQVLLMMCQVIEVRSDGTSYKARALLDSGSSASFISERVAQHLHLPRQRQDSKVNGIGGGTMHLSSQVFANFTVKPVHSGGKTHKIEALVLRKITSNIPSCSLAFDKDWNHLSNLTLTDPEFGVPGSVDILLEANVYSRTVLHGRQFGPSGSPSAIKTTFGWALAAWLCSSSGNSKSTTGKLLPCYLISR